MTGDERVPNSPTGETWSVRDGLKIVRFIDDAGQPVIVLKDPVLEKYYRIKNKHLAVITALRSGPATLEVLTARLAAAEEVFDGPEDVERTVARLRALSILEFGAEGLLPTDPTGRRVLSFLERHKALGQQESEALTRVRRYLSAGATARAFALLRQTRDGNPKDERARRCYRLALDFVLAERKRRSTPIDIREIRFKLFNPDRLLTWLDRYFGWAFSVPFFVLSAVFVLFALGIVIASWNDAFAPPQSPLGLAPILVFLWLPTLFLHEMAHGLACKHYGGEVKNVGVCLMLLVFPAAYCEVNDSHLFARRRHRMVVVFAGLYFTALQWAACVMVWRFMEPGFFISRLAQLSVSVLGVLLIMNLFPLLDLDGYFLLQDAVGIPNLRRRAIDYVVGRGYASSAKERYAFLAVGLGSLVVFLFTFSRLASWIWTSLTRNFHLLGLLLFPFVMVFFARRLVPYAKGWTRWVLDRRRRAVSLPLLAVLGTAAVATDFDRTLTVPVLFAPGWRTPVVAPFDGVMTSVRHTNGAEVRAGEELAVMDSEELRQAVAERSSRETILRARMQDLRRPYRKEDVQIVAREAQQARLALLQASQALKTARENVRRGLEGRARLTSAQDEHARRTAEWRLASAQLGARARPETARSLSLLALDLEQEGLARRDEESRLAQARLTSPVPGRLVRYVALGDETRRVRRGEMLFEIFDPSRLTGIAEVPMRDLPCVQQGGLSLMKVRSLPSVRLYGRPQQILVGGPIAQQTVPAPPAPWALQNEVTPNDSRRAPEETLWVRLRLETRVPELRPGQTGVLVLRCSRIPLLSALGHEVKRFFVNEIWPIL